MGSFKALTCFCLIMHSLKNTLKIEYVRVLENVNHASKLLYIHKIIYSIPSKHISF